MARPRTVWNNDCDHILVECLFKVKSLGKQTSNGNFHTSAWTSAEALLVGTEAHSGGTKKTASSCQTCWNTLKKEYKEVKQLKEHSGFGWDDEKGLVTAEDDVWERYLEAHPDLKKWRKNSFLLFDEIAELVEGSYATGQGLPDNEEDLIDPLLQSAAIDPPTPSTTPPASSSPPSATSTPPALAPALTATSNPVSSAPRSSRNGHRKSGSVAIDGMASSIDRLAAAVAADAVVPSPSRKRAAIHAIEDDGDLSDEEQLKVFKIIRRDTTFADTILAIRKQSARTRFIKSELYEMSED
ncbi:hypothetical protein H0H87_006689 [Tephrocybe sp. NHM501043]|nr:hypothetical protein H0H87_006689 [Tephrocybe sp. NHM501043]